MCRYLLSAPARPEDSQHPVRLMVGNGMRPQIWQQFVDRFKIEQITEVYGSSEGNANIGEQIALEFQLRIDWLVVSAVINSLF